MRSTIKEWTDTINDNTDHALRQVLTDALKGMNLESASMSDELATKFESIKDDVVAFTMLLAVANMVERNNK